MWHRPGSVEHRGLHQTTDSVDNEDPGFQTGTYALAMVEAVLCFWSGLTRDEREDASEDIQDSRSAESH
jgi:hypothetical protein